jgi:hypothetical protein
VASQTAVTDWAIEHSSELNLRVDVFEWTSRWIPGYFDCSVSIEVDGSNFVGRSTSKDSELSLTKAIAEAVERAAVAFHRLPSSNGVAAHTQPNIAIRNGFWELFERDSFLCHYLTQTPFFSLPASDSLELVRGAKEAAAKLGVSLDVYGMSVPNGLAGAVCIARGAKCRRRFGILVSSGCNSELHMAVESAVLSCLRNVSAWLDGQNIKVLSRDEFLELGEWGPEEHRAVGLHLDSGKSILESSSANVCSREGSSYLDHSFSAEKLELGNSEVFRSCPIVVYRALSSSLLPLFFGPTKISAIDHDRLSEFSGVDGTALDLNCFPHPLC